MNLALWPDDLYMIIQSLVEVLSSLDTCLFYAKNAHPLSAVTRGSIYIRSYSKRNSLRVILEHFDMPATQLLGNEDLCLLGYNYS